MKKIIALLTIIASILACAPSQSAIHTSVAETQTAIAQTQVAQVTQAPQLSDINLDSIPCQPGDLLEPYHCGQIIYNRWVEDLPQVAEPDNVIVQRVGWDISNDLNNDFVLIALFKSNDDLQNSFEEVRKVFPTTETSPVVGDRSTEYISADIGPGFLTFIHCSALVVIQFDGATVTEDMVMSYAQRIDKRLKPLVCQHLTTSEFPGNDVEKKEPAEQIVYYYFVDLAKNAPPKGSVVIVQNELILAPTQSDISRRPDTATYIGTALQSMINDPRNVWTSTQVGITSVTFEEGVAHVVLDGEFFGAGDVILIAARMQILMTVFTDASVQSATVSINGKNIANLGISHLSEVKPDGFVYTRAEIETFMAENAYVNP